MLVGAAVVSGLEVAGMIFAAASLLTQILFEIKLPTVEVWSLEV